MKRWLAFVGAAALLAGCQTNNPEGTNGMGNSNDDDYDINTTTNSASGAQPISIRRMGTAVDHSAHVILVDD